MTDFSLEDNIYIDVTVSSKSLFNLCVQNNQHFEVHDKDISFQISQVSYIFKCFLFLANAEAVIKELIGNGPKALFANKFVTVIFS